MACAAAKVLLQSTESIDGVTCAHLSDSSWLVQQGAVTTNTLHGGYLLPCLQDLEHLYPPSLSEVGVSTSAFPASGLGSVSNAIHHSKSGDWWKPLLLQAGKPEVD